MEYPTLYRELFRSLIDYAGLFPPAALPLKRAITNYSDYLKGDHSNILSHFVLPVAKFSEVTAELSDLFTEQYPLSLSVIPASLVNDMEAIIAFSHNGGSRILLGAIETRFSLESDFVSELASHSAAHMELPPECIAFYEVPAGEDWDELSVVAINALAATRAETGAHVGFKLRCGGVDNSVIPSVEQVAAAILRCGEARVPMKFTAGIHHPFRHENKERGCFLHGFFNLFFAGIAVQSGLRDLTSICSFISETNSQSVSLTEKGLTWLGHTVDVVAVKAARKESVISFGSCSFTEPIEDAKELGWL